MYECVALSCSGSDMEIAENGGFSFDAFLVINGKYERIS
jgi:hypothetical protein